jgi:hypothetical protein
LNDGVDVTGNLHGIIRSMRRCKSGCDERGLRAVESVSDTLPVRPKVAGANAILPKMPGALDKAHPPAQPPTHKISQRWLTEH